MLSDAERATLAVICDTVVPSIAKERDPDGFWARKATDLRVDEAAAQLIAEIPDPALRDGLRELIGAIGQQGIALASPPSREQILRNVALSGPQAAAGVNALINMTLFLAYGAPDPETGRNPNWKTLGYPGPLSPPPQVPKPLQVHEPAGTEETLEADAVIVGSGAGGAVVAAGLAQAGLDVVVLEAAGYFNESDFDQLELPAYQRMFWRGGPNPTADGNVSLVAGTTLGGGTTINWTNCLRTREWVREEWAREHGLEGVDGPDFDRHLDAVMQRIGVTDACSELNGPQQRMREGAEALGWHTETIARNTDPSSYSPESAAFLGFGDQSGSKRSADRTWLADAQGRGARLLTYTRATRVLVADGRAAGVEAEWAPPAGGGAKVTVRAPRVVVACGSLESPALLARSGIGGPAVGDFLRLHPCSVVGAMYGTDQRAWWGAPQAGLVDEFADTGEGYGFLVETAQYAPGLIGSATPWISGEDHKQRMSEFANTASFISLTRDRGHGRVHTDATGEAIPLYPLSDELDLANLRRGVEVQVRLHEAAGAQQIFPLAAGAPIWRRGEDLGAFIHAAQRIPFRAGGYRLFSAHQMGSCRMGEDPASSVADPRGELHDTKGVWIGDGSAFPTSSGTNPMVSIMALAHRTAELMAADAGAGRADEQKPPPSPPERTKGALVATEAPPAPAPAHPSEPVVRDRLYIGGEWAEPAGSGTIDVLDSTTEQVIGTIPEGTPDDVDRAVAAARAAFEGWSGLPIEQRLDACQAIAAQLAERGDELAVLIAAEVGMPLRLSRTIQAGLPVMDFGGIAQVASEVAWEERIGNSLVVREPVGVLGAITPWNYPLHQLCAKVAPALAAGCTIVAKPSEVTPLSAFVLAEIIDEIGLPPGVVNLVTGYGPVVGEAIAAHPGVDMVSFTGSTRAGRRVSEVASGNVKRVSLELGGKSANVILDDADLKSAVSHGVSNCFLNSGQTCSAHTRMLVPRSQLAEAERIAAAAAEKLKPGDPLEQGSRLGPLVSDAQRERVRGYIRKGEEEGAKLIAGGAEPPEGLDRGYFVRPTVFSEVKPEMTIAQEEIFGPVLSIIPYDDEDEAAEIANGTIYGLDGGVWSGDPERAKAFARRMRTGQVQVNGATFNPLAPFGGYKQSGHGRELGRFGLEEFLETKSIQL